MFPNPFSPLFLFPLAAAALPADQKQMWGDSCQEDAESCIWPTTDQTTRRVSGSVISWFLLRQITWVLRVLKYPRSHTKPDSTRRVRFVVCFYALNWLTLNSLCRHENKVLLQMFSNQRTKQHSWEPVMMMFLWGRLWLIGAQQSSPNQGIVGLIPSFPGHVSKCPWTEGRTKVNKQHTCIRLWVFQMFDDQCGSAISRGKAEPKLTFQMFWLQKDAVISFI